MRFSVRSLQFVFFFRFVLDFGTAVKFCIEMLMRHFHFSTIAFSKRITYSSVYMDLYSLLYALENGVKNELKIYMQNSAHKKREQEKSSLPTTITVKIELHII